MMSGDTSTRHARLAGGRWATVGRRGGRRWLPVLVAALVLVPLGPLAHGQTTSGGSSGTWIPTGSMTTGRYAHTATLLSDGQVLVAGGAGSTNFASAELYNPRTGTWMLTGFMTTVRIGPTATLLPSGQVLVAGGGNGGTNLSSAELYNPSTGTWTPTGSMSIARTHHTATLLLNGQVLVAGGCYACGGPASAELYNPRTGTWTRTRGMHAVRANHTATLLPNGTVLVAGGNTCGGCPTTSAELYSPNTTTWTLTGSMSTARTYHTATLLPNGQVLVAGGCGGGKACASILASAELYNPSTGAWTTIGRMGSARQYHTATLLPNGQVLVAGGCGVAGCSIPLSSTELYDPGKETWTQADSMATARYYDTATLLQSGQVLVAGGFDNSALSSAELYALAPPVPTLVITPSSGVYTRPITLTGSNFGPSEQVTVYVNSTRSTPVFTTTTDGTGSFVLSGHAWQNTYGLHHVIAVGQSSGLTALTRFFLKPSLTLTPNTGAAGTQTTVAGYDFGATERVVWRWGSPTGLTLGTTTSNGLGGTAAMTVTVPASATAGTYPVYGVGQSSGAQAGADFTVP